MNSVLQEYINTVPVIKDAFGMDIMMSITDGYEFLAYWPGDKMVADIHVGDPLSHDDPMWTSFTTGRKLEQICPADVYGFAFKAITIAIRDGAEIVGTMGIAISMETETFTKEASERLLASANLVQQEVEGSNELNEKIRTSSQIIKESSDRILENIKAIHTFAADIQKISKKTNMLSLNASIEAARAGDVGRGFAVVADQMNKLANETKSSSEKILVLVDQFTDDIDLMNSNLEVQDESQTGQVELIQKLFDEVQNIEETTNQVIDKIS